MSNNESQRRRPINHKVKMEESSERLDSGLGLDSLTDRSSTDSLSFDNHLRDQECCDSTRMLTEKTAQMNLNVEDGVKSSDVEDEGYSTFSNPSFEKQSLNFAHHPADFEDGRSSRAMISPEAQLFCYLSCFAQTQDLRYLIAPYFSHLLIQNDDGDTSLHVGIINGHEQFVMAMIDVLAKKEYFDIYNNLSQTPLHLAVITRQPKIVQKLIDYGAGVDLVDRNGQTCVHLACERGDLRSLKAIFKTRPSNIELKKKLPDILETRNFNGLTPLCVAVKANKIEIVKELLRLGADSNAIDSKSGNTALHLATEDDNLPMVSCLLFQGNADPNAMSYSGSTPLHLAAGLELETIVATLIAVGASPSLENLEGDTAFKIVSEGSEDNYDDDLEME